MLAIMQKYLLKGRTSDGNLKQVRSLASFLGLHRSFIFFSLRVITASPEWTYTMLPRKFIGPMQQSGAGGLA